MPQGSDCGCGNRSGTAPSWSSQGMPVNRQPVNQQVNQPARMVQQNVSQGLPQGGQGVQQGIPPPPCVIM